MDRIARIEAFPIHYPDPNDFGAIRRTVLVRVETGHGVVGWGECIALWPEACRAVVTIIDEGLTPILLGEPAGEIEANWSRMRRHAWWYGGIIRGEIDGPRVCYALKPEALAPLATFIAGLAPPPDGPCRVPVTVEPS